MFIYYKKYTLKKEEKTKNWFNENSLETRVESPKTPKLESFPQTQIKTVGRWKVKPSIVHRLIEKLETESKKSDNTKERIEIKKKMREIRTTNKPYGHKTNGIKTNSHPTKYESTTKHFIDLNGQTIGEVYKIAKYNKNIDLIRMSGSRLIEDIGFDFTRLNSEDSCLRTFAYLTEEGKDGLRVYLQKCIRNRLSYHDHRRNPKLKRASKREVKRIIRTKNAYDIKIMGMNVHVNLRGKVELFTQYSELSRLLISNENLTTLQNKRLRKFTEYAGVKKWIYDTTPSFNEFIGKTFRELSRATQTIFAGYGPRIYTANTTTQKF